MSLTVESILTTLKSSYRDTPVNEQIDAIFLLDRGALINFGDGKGYLNFIDHIDKNSLDGFHLVSEADSVLRVFITWLMAIMPNIFYFQHPINQYLLNDIGHDINKYNR